jgi:hypothetical protein
VLTKKHRNRLAMLNYRTGKRRPTTKMRLLGVRRAWERRHAQEDA